MSSPPHLSQQEMFDELCFYTLAHPSSEFIHQNAVDAFAAQTADESTKNIKIVFALVGLYLALERSYTGKEVQRVHMQLAARRKDWPRPELPLERGKLTVAHVLKAEAGEERDRAIRAWCLAVWEPYDGTRELVRALLITELDLG